MAGASSGVWSGAWDAIGGCAAGACSAGPPPTTVGPTAGVGTAPRSRCRSRLVRCLQLLRCRLQSRHDSLKIAVLDLLGCVQPLNQTHGGLHILPLLGDGLVSTIAADTLLDACQMPAAVAVHPAVRRLAADSQRAQYLLGKQPEPVANHRDGRDDKGYDYQHVEEVGHVTHRVTKCRRNGRGRSEASC